MLILAHPTGNAFVRELGAALATANLLSEFHTCLDYPADERWLGFVPEGWRREARRRRLPDALKPFARLHPWRELARLFALRRLLPALGRHETGFCSIDQIYQSLDRQVAARLPACSASRAVYLYEDGALASFTAARARGLTRFYDLPIGYWRAAKRILSEEAELSPEWAGTMPTLVDSPAKLARKDAELAQADTVFVASTFTRNTLAEAPHAPTDVVVTPYGAPLILAARPTPARAPGTPFRVLFVGSLGQRKGTRYLLEAMAALGPGFELTLIGTLPAARCDPLAAALRRHRHIPSLPHGEILAEMSRHHAFVFPSLFEGFGLVLLEAMACGLPVIATPHTAAPDIVREGRDGFIVPIRDTAAIAERLTWLAADEDRRQTMGQQARCRAQQFTWDSYTKSMISAISTRLTMRASAPEPT